MVIRRKLRFRSVVPFQHPRRMGYPDQKHGIATGLSSSILDRSARMLLQNVVNMLKTREVPALDTIYAFIEPTNCRSECHTKIADLARPLKLSQSFPNGIAVDLFHSDIMQLQEINPICPESGQSRIRRSSNRFGGKILGYLSLSSSLGAIMHTIVANLRVDY